MNTEFVERLLKLFAENDFWGELGWNKDLQFWVVCSDVFSWGTADAENVDEGTIDVLEQAIADCGGDVDGITLYACRQRKMRPQGAMYQNLEEKHWPLFDACGPKREKGFMNPVDRD